MYWPENGAPSGTYKVWVDYWSSCQFSGTTNFRVTRVLNQTNIEVFEGNFVSGDVENDPYSDMGPLFEFQY